MVPLAMLREYGPEDSWGDVPSAYAAFGKQLSRFADALEFYLPPEG
jgi:hypothetical protein